ncbi:MAG: translation initiation factor IF-2 [bacterium]|nr:translation initiation factor IF-2 [bacterium]
MLSIKLHEATKQFKISNKLAMFFLERMNIPVKSHSSVISMDQLEMLREFAADKNKHPVWAEFNRSEKDKKQKGTKAKEETKVETKVAVENIIMVSDKVFERDSPPKPEPGETAKKIEAETPRPAQPHRTRPEPHPQPSGHAVSRTPAQPKPHPKPYPQPSSQPPVQPKPQAEPQPGSQPKPARDQKPKPHQPQSPPKPHAQEKSNKPRHDAPKQTDRREKPAERKPEHQHPKAGVPARPNDRDPRGPVGQKDQKDRSRFQPHPRSKDNRDRPSFKGRGGKQQNRSNRHNQSRYQQDRRGPYVPPAPKKPKVPKVFDLPELIQTSNFINIRELAEKLNLKLKDIEEKMLSLKLKKDYVTTQLLDVEDIREICKAFNVQVDIVSYEADIFNNHVKKDKGEQTLRAPVVTVMGHVDHGKTTLLDTLRNTRVADREAGGITQTIGAYKLSSKGNEIVFIDTPGHEAFTNIRARGAKVTDIVVLVVAANDGVKPQTIEAINHAQAAKVPIIVAINKIDLDGASPDRVKQELTQHNLVVEDWGGDVVSVEISAKFNKNLDSLLEMIGLVSEIQELKAYKSIPARGTIIESRLDPKLGSLGTVLIQHGQLERGDFFICGNSVGKVKSIFDDKGKVLKNAQVPMPIEIMGFEEVPEAGELFQVTDDIDKARKVIDSRKIQGKEALKGESVNEQKLSLQSLFQRLEDDKTKVFPIIMKTDNFSSGEVLEKILLKHSQDKLKINIIHQGVGNITESDILLASTSGSIIVGFNVKAPQKLIALAKRENVEIKLYNVIYHLIEDIDKAIKGEIEPEYVENQIGSVEVLQTFKISKIGIIAGCLVKEGKVNIKSRVKVLRKNDLVFEGELETLRRVKNDASEVNAGTECGIKIKNFNAIEIGDMLEIYETIIKEIK